MYYVGKEQWIQRFRPDAIQLQSESLMFAPRYWSMIRFPRLTVAH